MHYYGYGGFVCVCGGSSLRVCVVARFLFLCLLIGVISRIVARSPTAAGLPALALLALLLICSHDGMV